VLRIEINNILENIFILFFEDNYINIIFILYEFQYIPLTQNMITLNKCIIYLFNINGRES